MHKQLIRLLSLLAIFALLLAGCTQPIPIMPSAAPVAEGGDTAASDESVAPAVAGQPGGVGPGRRSAMPRFSTRF